MITTSSKLAAGGRVLIALIYLFSGVGKILAPGATQAYIASAGLPMPLLAYLLAIVIEVVGGILLVIGFRTRIVASLMAIYTIAAALGFHRDFSNQDQLIHFLKNISMTGGLLQVVAFGAGVLGVDGQRRSGPM
jgi:putative oxidoreductase